MGIKCDICHKIFRDERGKLAHLRFCNKKARKNNKRKKATQGDSLDYLCDNNNGFDEYIPRKCISKNTKVSTETILFVKCDYCEEHDSSILRLSKHVKKEHKRDYSDFLAKHHTHVCLKCDQKFLTASARTKHQTRNCKSRK